MTDWTLDGKNVLITGGTGSFANAFIKVVMAKHNLRRLVVFSRDEFKQHEMQQRIADPDNILRYFLGDVRDRDRLYMAFKDVDVVLHTAALKQVPAAEYNPIEAKQTNIDGAANVIRAALDRNVDRVIALSTDKCVNPVNLYGATKLVMEKLMVQANSYRGDSGTRFACVRYGNVVGSRGSVVPLFREQAKSGRITVTDPRMTRFLITLDAGVCFVLSSLAMMHGGEVFVPKLPSAHILDIARAVAPGCDIVPVGIRPGEKLAELLLSADEAQHTLDLGDRYVVQPTHPWWAVGHHCGTPLPDGWCYASDTNPWVLTGEELEVMLDGEL